MHNDINNDWLGGKLVVLPVSQPRMYGTMIAKSGMVNIVKDKNIV